MTDQHPITPPPELVEQWRIAPEYASGLKKLMMVTMTEQRLQEIATQAARWGADKELEACCEWLNFYAAGAEATDLRAARRPKPLSLAEEALEAMQRMWEGSPDADDWSLIRRALERLQGLERQSDG